MTTPTRHRTGFGPVPQCPVRPGDACSLCHPGAHGPEDCGLVQLVMADPEMRARLAEIRAEALAEGRLRAG